MPITFRVPDFRPGAMLLAACLAWSGGAAAGESARPVTLAEVKSETLRDQVNLPGSAIPWRKTRLSPRVDGLVTEVVVDEGSWVQRGDAVLLLDDRLAAIDMETARARVEEARAGYRDAVRRRDELMRLKEGRHTAQSAIDSAIAEVETQAAVLTREQAALTRANELAERHAVYAPFSGMVVGKLVEVGEWVQRNDPVVELVSMDTLRIRAALPQRDYPRVEPGASALVRFDALPQQSFAGTVFARPALGNASTRSFPLLIDIPNENHLLAPGMSARVWVQLKDGVRQGLTVPRDALVARADGRQLLWRVKQDDDAYTVQAVPVETGRAYDARVEIVSGDIAAGERVVLLGNENLRPGDRVRPQSASAAIAGRAED